MPNKGLDSKCQTRLLSHEPEPNEQLVRLRWHGQSLVRTLWFGEQQEVFRPATAFILIAHLYLNMTSPAVLHAKTSKTACIVELHNVLGLVALPPTSCRLNKVLEG